MDYEFNYTMTQSKSYKQIRQDITREIWSRVKKFMDTINLVQNFMMFSIVLVLLKLPIGEKPQYMTLSRPEKIPYQSELPPPDATPIHYICRLSHWKVQLLIIRIKSARRKLLTTINVQFATVFR
ncbi:hypothetical protein CHS0354_032072 [Potamilus streckersoni]|uniref:Uncharacterized protein n=1 Tax=Potamilus streckersoni TaxID=2493646 RepID=A0AAE0TPL0_9BIVA|nr:hypothetical protein CHS0354_032072 [Potamilus streckersoni]